MKQLLTFLATLILVFSLAACATGTTSLSNETQYSATNAEAIVVESEGTGSTTVNTAQTTNSTAAVADILAENSPVHEDAEDYTRDSAEAISIRLNDDSINVEGAGVSVVGATATITAAGTYSLSGALADGQIIVDTQDEEVVRLILNGVDLHSTTSAPIYIANAEETVIILADNTQNTVTDGSGYVYADMAAEEPNAAIFSNSDLSISGNGSLIVNGNFNDGIASKDGLIIASGTVTVNAVDDGIRGKDYLAIEDGNITVNAQGDGLKADNEEDATKGYVSIQAGQISVTAGGDAIDAQTDVLIAGGTLTLTAGGGSGNQIDEAASAKGIKGVVNVSIDGGTFTIDSADDAIHTNGSIVINAGTFDIASGDDGMHADATLEINSGDIQINRSYEGIESAVITINNGEIRLVASDDGINVAGGVDGSGMNQGMRPGGGAGKDMTSYSGSYYLYIHGGYVAVEAAGDGVDVNGAIEMTDGVVLVNGPTENMNGALDYDGTFNIFSGFFVAAGSAGMAQAPGQNSSQNSVLINFSSTLPAGTLVHIQNSAGEEILTFAPTKQYQSIAFSSAGLVRGETYTVYVGGSSNGTASDSLFEGGVYTPGEQYTSFTVSSTVTLVGAAGFGGGRPRRP